MATADLTNGVPAAREAGHWSLGAVLLFAVLAMAGHALVSTEWLRWQWAVEMQADSRVFAAVGVMFVVLTLLSHLPVLRVMSRDDAPAPADRQTTAPLTALLVSMAIRLLGTFLVLAGLLAVQVVGRSEAVFDVLFWYVTLTTIEVVGIVWASKSLAKSASTKFDPATKGV